MDPGGSATARSTCSRGTWLREPRPVPLGLIRLFAGLVAPLLTLFVGSGLAANSTCPGTNFRSSAGRSSSYGIVGNGWAEAQQPAPEKCSRESPTQKTPLLGSPKEQAWLEGCRAWQRDCIIIL